MQQRSNIRWFCQPSWLILSLIHLHIRQCDERLVLPVGLYHLALLTTDVPDYRTAKINKAYLLFQLLAQQLIIKHNNRIICLLTKGQFTLRWHDTTKGSCKAAGVATSWWGSDELVTRKLLLVDFLADLSWTHPQHHGLVVNILRTSETRLQLSHQLVATSCSFTTATRNFHHLSLVEDTMRYELKMGDSNDELLATVIEMSQLSMYQYSQGRHSCLCLHLLASHRREFQTETVNVPSSSSSTGCKCECDVTCSGPISEGDCWLVARFELCTH